MRTLIVPARSGSKRIPDKNKRPFLGVPAIARSLAIAKQSDIFDHIHVSTDSPEIADIASTAGVPPRRLRPVHLAGDAVPLRDVLIYEASEVLASTFGQEDLDTSSIQVWMMLPCAVLAIPDDLHRAAQIMDSTPSNQAVLSVAEFPAPIEWATAIGADGLLHIADSKAWSIPSQLLSRHYYDTGMFSGFTLSTLIKMKDPTYYPDFRPVVIDAWRAVDIDTLQDWEHAERIFPLLDSMS